VRRLLESRSLVLADQLDALGRARRSLRLWMSGGDGLRAEIARPPSQVRPGWGGGARGSPRASGGSRDQLGGLLLVDPGPSDGALLASGRAAHQGPPFPPFALQLQVTSTARCRRSAPRWHTPRSCPRGR